VTAGVLVLTRRRPALQIAGLAALGVVELAMCLTVSTVAVLSI
jgi:hypothetical protein